MNALGPEATVLHIPKGQQGDLLLSNENNRSGAFDANISNCWRPTIVGYGVHASSNKGYNVNDILKAADIGSIFSLSYIRIELRCGNAHYL